MKMWHGLTLQKVKSTLHNESVNPSYRECRTWGKSTLGQWPTSRERRTSPWWWPALTWFLTVKAIEGFLSMVGSQMKILTSHQSMKVPSAELRFLQHMDRRRSRPHFLVPGPKEASTLNGDKMDITLHLKAHPLVRSPFTPDYQA